ncbi:MAG: hypothetical protein ACK48P_03765, partial [Holosporales bacterium]
PFPPKQMHMKMRHFLVAVAADVGDGAEKADEFIGAGGGRKILRLIDAPKARIVLKKQRKRQT